MKTSFWQSRTLLILTGILLGYAARAILGPPLKETPAGPRFENPLPEEVPFSIPLDQSRESATKFKATGDHCSNPRWYSL